MNRRWLEILFGLLALLIGAAGAWYGRARYLQAVTLVSLPVPKADIAPYTLLSADLFAQADYPRALVAAHADYVEELAELSGQISTQKLLAGLPVPRREAVAPEAFRLADPSLEVLSLPVSPESFVGGQVQRGEVVHLYRTNAWKDTAEDENGKPQEFSEVIWIASAPVIDVLTKAGDPAGEPIQEKNARQEPAQILVLAAPPETVARILEAQALAGIGNNRLWISLAEIPSER